MVVVVVENLLSLILVMVIALMPYHIRLAGKI